VQHPDLPPAMTLRSLLAPLAVVTAALPLMAAAAPQPAFVPFNPNSPAVRNELKAVQTDTVDQFDPVARAKTLASEMPRRWSGTYVGYAGGTPQTVVLNLSGLDPVGQMVVLRGTMTIGSLSTPVQGNLNAKSDQLDLLVLSDTSSIGLEPGGAFQGLQTFQLSAWEAPRLTNPGGKLLLEPSTGTQTTRKR
jgi:hypothetical protein